MDSFEDITGQEEIVDEPLNSGGADDTDDGAGGDAQSGTNGSDTDGGVGSLPDELPDDMTDDIFGGFDGDAGGTGDGVSSGASIWLVVLPILLIAAAALLIFLRLRATDPLRMTDRAGNGRDRAFILFRAILTLYSSQGFEMRGGETPAGFLERLSAVGVDTAPCASFADAIAGVAYSPSADAEAAEETGKAAYKAVRAAAKLPDRLRFDIHRIFRGIGDTRNVP